MSSSLGITFTGDSREAIAPWWHTVLVLAALGGLFISAGHQNGYPNAHIPGMSSRLSSYLTIMPAEWFLVFLIWLGIRRCGLTVASLVSGRWETPSSFFKDLGLGVGFIVAIIALEQALFLLLHASPDSGLERTMPKTVLELAVYLILSVTGGFCEELIFRGYLMRQFSAWTGSNALGIEPSGLAPLWPSIRIPSGISAWRAHGRAGNVRGRRCSISLRVRERL